MANTVSERMTTVHPDITRFTLQSFYFHWHQCIVASRVPTPYISLVPCSSTSGTMEPINARNDHRRSRLCNTRHTSKDFPFRPLPKPKIQWSQLVGGKRKDVTYNSESSSETEFIDEVEQTQEDFTCRADPAANRFQRDSEEKHHGDCFPSLCPPIRCDGGIQPNSFPIQHYQIQSKRCATW